MSKLSDRIIQVLIRKDVSIHAQLFRFMSLLGTIAMAVGGVYTLAEGMEIKNVAALFAGALFMGMLFWAGNKFQQYDLCSFILMSGLNGIFLPVTFLRSGGLKSGMPLWFCSWFHLAFFPAAGEKSCRGNCYNDHCGCVLFLHCICSSGTDHLYGIGICSLWGYYRECGHNHLSDLCVYVYPDHTL